MFFVDGKFVNWVRTGNIKKPLLIVKIKIIIKMKEGAEEYKTSLIVKILR